MQSTIITSDLRQKVSRLAGAATTRRQVASAVFDALKQSSIRPEGVSLDDMKTLVTHAVLAARIRRPLFGQLPQPPRQVSA